MPAPNISTLSPVPTKGFGHVNLQTDTFLANANIDLLRGIMRDLLAVVPGLTSVLLATARTRLQESELKQSTEALFEEGLEGHFVHTQTLDHELSVVRVLFGVGLAFESLPTFTRIVRATTKLPEHKSTPLCNKLAEVNNLINQALQSCKEQVSRLSGEEYSNARRTVGSLLDSLQDARTNFGDNFPFETATESIMTWQFMSITFADDPVWFDGVE